MLLASSYFLLLDLCPTFVFSNPKALFKKKKVIMVMGTHHLNSLSGKVLC